MRLVILLFIILLQPFAFAQVSQNMLDKNPPQSEFGIGSILLNIPDYPGSGNNRFRGFAFPYFIYRGRYLRTDDEGTRARFLTSKIHEIGLSFAFNFPVKSSKNPMRDGMPDLDALIGLGPRLLLRIINEESQHRLNFSVALKGIYSTNFYSRFRSEGIITVPSINYWYRWKESRTTFFSNLGFEFGSAKYNRYFYEVPIEFSNASRPRFKAEAGLVESSLGIGFGQTISEDVFIFSGLSWRNLNLAKNRDSPLVEKQNNIGFIFGVIWTFYESEKRVQPLPAMP